MPTVPRVTAPTVGSTALAGAGFSPRATSASFGGIEAQQLGQLAGAVGTAAQVAIDMQEQEDANNVLRAETEIKARMAEQQIAFKDRRGQNAWGLTKEATKSWDDNYKEINSGLTTQRQQQMLAQRTANTRLSFFESMSAHEQTQRREALESNAKANIQATISFATANAGNPDVLAEARMDIKRHVGFLAQSNGWTKDRREVELTEQLTEMHTQIIQELALETPGAAKEYFNATKKEIDGLQHAELKTFIEDSSSRVIAQRVGDEAMVTGQSEDEAVAAARKKFEGSQEDKVVAEIQSRFKERRDTIKQNQDEAFDAAWEVLAREKRFTAIEPGLLRNLSGQQIQALETAASQQVSGDPSTEFTRFYELMDIARNSPEEFANLDLRLHFAKLKPAHRERLINLQTGAATKTPGYLKAVTTEQRLANTYRQLGLVGSLSESEQRQKGVFADAVYDRISDEQERIGKDLTSQQEKAIIDDLTREVVIDPSSLPGWVPLLGEERARVFELNEDDIARAEPGDDMRAQVLDYFQKELGISTPTSDQINAIYRDHLRRLKGVQ